MKRIRRILAITLVLTMLTAVFGACANQSEATTKGPSQESTAASTAATTQQSTAEEKPVKFTIATSTAGGELEIGYNLYKAEHPNVEVEFQIVDHNTLQEKWLVCVQSGTLPDVFWWNGLYLQQTMEGTPDVLVDLTPYYTDEFIGNLSPVAFDYAKAGNGKYCLFPSSATITGILWNKSLFDQFGLEIPKTDKELLAAAKVFTQNGITTMGYSSKDLYYCWIFEEWTSLWGIWQEAEDIFVTQKKTVEDSDFVNAFYFIADLAEAGAFPSNTSTISYDQVKTMFNAGQYACIQCTLADCMVACGTGTKNDITDKCVFNYGISFADSPYDQKKCQQGVSNGYGLGASAADSEEKLNAIVDFFDWYYQSKECVVANAKAGNLMPVSMDIDLSGEDVPVYMSQALDLLSSDYVGEKSAAYTYVDAWNYVSDYIQAYHQAVQMKMYNGLVDGSVKRSDMLDIFKEGTAIIAKNIKDGALNK